jgi:hypothetical protein
MHLCQAIRHAGQDRHYARDLSGRYDEEEWRSGGGGAGALSVRGARRPSVEHIDIQKQTNKQKNTKKKNQKKRLPARPDVGSGAPRLKSPCSWIGSKLAFRCFVLAPDMDKRTQNQLLEPVNLEES